MYLTAVASLDNYSYSDLTLLICSSISILSHLFLNLVSFTTDKCVLQCSLNFHSKVEMNSHLPCSVVGDRQDSYQKSFSIMHALVMKEM